MARQLDFVFRLSELARAMVGVLLFLAITLPTAFVEIKGGVLGFAIVLILICASIKIFLVLPGVVVSCVFFSALGVIWSLWGVINGNPGAVSVLTVMAVYPILFMILIQVYRDGDGGRLFNIFVVSAWFVVLGDLAFVYLSIYFPGSVVEVLFQHLYADWAVVDHEYGYLKFTLPNVASLIFLLPFLIAGFLEKYSSIRTFWLMILICLCLVVGILSGRRALLLMVVVGPFLAYMFTMRFSDFRVINNLSASKFMSGIIFLIGFGFILYYSYTDYVADLISSAFDFRENESNLERAFQFEALLHGVVDAPFFGHGAGAVAGYIRSDEMPWAYELFYLSIIFQYGLVGFLAYFFCIAFLILFLVNKIRKSGRSSFEFCYLAGFLSFLLASATNPYIAKFDYMWIIFIPLAIVNYDFVVGVLRRKRLANAC